MACEACKDVGLVVALVVEPYVPPGRVRTEVHDDLGVVVCVPSRGRVRHRLEVQRCDACEVIEGDLEAKRLGLELFEKALRCFAPWMAAESLKLRRSK